MLHCDYLRRKYECYVKNFLNIYFNCTYIKFGNSSSFLVDIFTPEFLFLSQKKSPVFPSPKILFEAALVVKFSLFDKPSENLLVVFHK